MASLYSKVFKFLESKSKSSTEITEWLNDEKTILLVNHGSGDEIESWDSATVGVAKPTDSELNSLDSQATTLENNAKIDAKRRTEYLPFEDQLEMIYKDQKNGTSTYKDHCDKVRSDNPKE